MYDLIEAVATTCAVQVIVLTTEIFISLLSHMGVDVTIIYLVIHDGPQSVPSLSIKTCHKINDDFPSSPVRTQTH